jgi:hypothetical protein
VGTSNVGECFSRVEAINTDPLLTYCFISRVVTGVTNARCKDGPIFTLRVGKQARLPNALCVPLYDSVARQPALGPNAVSPEISSSRAATRFQHHMFCLRRISRWTSSRRAPRCRQAVDDAPRAWLRLPCRTCSLPSASLSSLVHVACTAPDSVRTALGSYSKESRVLFMKGLKGAITESKNFMCKCRRRHYVAQDEDCRRSKGTGRLTAFGPGSVKTHAVSAERKKRLVRSLYIGLALRRGKETPKTQ